nr:SMC-Scp complex subunit ScpB [Rhizocola hellebori]
MSGTAGGAAAGAGGDGGSAAGGEGGSAAKKGRSKRATGEGASLKDGLAVAEMLAKALPEQRSKPRKADDDADAEADLEAEEDDEPENYREYEPGEFKGALEAILMVVDEPVSELVLATVLEVRAEDVANALMELSASYTSQGRGFDLRRAAGGWRYYTRAEYSSFVERFVLDGQQLRLTQASLETLAVVAYKQPVTRARIAAIRGVNVDGVIRTLITRGMVEECGSDPDSGGHLYRTTTLFLEKMGLDSVEQLPPLAPFLPDNLEELANGE